MGALKDLLRVRALICGLKSTSSGLGVGALGRPIKTALHNLQGKPYSIITTLSLFHLYGELIVSQKKRCIRRALKVVFLVLAYAGQ